MHGRKHNGANVFWDGFLVTAEGTAHTTSTFLCEGRDGPVATKSEQSVAWRAWTNGHHDAFLIRLELPSPETYVTVQAGGIMRPGGLKVQFKTNLIPAELEAKLQAEAKARAKKAPRPRGKGRGNK